jgi:hypothetical protein
VVVDPVDPTDPIAEAAEGEEAAAVDILVHLGLLMIIPLRHHLDLIMKYLDVGNALVAALRVVVDVGLMVVLLIFSVLDIANHRRLVRKERKLSKRRLTFAMQNCLLCVQKIFLQVMTQKHAIPQVAWKSTFWKPSSHFYR